MAKVTHCICHNRSFEQVKEIAESENITTLHELKSRNICSNSCGLCAPYVELMLKTGETEFDARAPFRKL